MPELPVPANVPRRALGGRLAKTQGSVLCPGHEHYRFYEWYAAGTIEVWSSPLPPLVRTTWLKVFNGELTAHGASVIPPHVILFLSADRGRDPLCQGCPFQLTCLGESTVH